MVRRISGSGQILLSMSVLALAGLSGCGGSVGTGGTNPLAAGPAANPGVSAAPVNPGRPGVTPSAVGDSVTANANGAVLTTTRTLSYDLSNAALSGGGWQATALLEADNADASSPRVMFDAAGNGFAAWTQNSDTIVRRYTASTATWSAPVILDTRAEEAHQARLAVDRSSGDAIVSWTQSDGTAESVYVSRFNSTANTWSSAQLLEEQQQRSESLARERFIIFHGTACCCRLAASRWRGQQHLLVEVGQRRMDRSDAGGYQRPTSAAP